MRFSVFSFTTGSDNQDNLGNLGNISTLLVGAFYNICGIYFSLSAPCCYKGFYVDGAL